MTKPKTPPSFQDLAARIERLRAATGPKPGGRKADVQPTSGMGMAFAISTHMVAGLGVGAGLGYLLDRWLGTSPGLLIVFFVLGAAAGFLNVYRTVSHYGMAFGYRPATTAKPEADQEEADGDIGKRPAPPGGKNDHEA